MILGLAQGLERLWLMRFGVTHAAQMLLLWRRFAVLDSTQLGTGKANIIAAFHRSGDFTETPLMGMGYGSPDSASREEP